MRILTILLFTNETLRIIVHYVSRGAVQKTDDRKLMSDEKTAEKIPVNLIQLTLT